MTQLPIHPYTGLRAIGFTRRGPIWPVMGGAEPPADPPADPAKDPVVEPPKPGDPANEPLGPPGLKALQKEREAREALEKQVAELAPLKKFADALGVGTPAAGGKTELELLNERFAQHETQLTEERAARYRAEVAAEKGLTAAQAARLAGMTREELAADADALKALFPTAPAAPGTPAPDPSQGARGSTVDLDSRIAEAQKAGNVMLAISLQNQKFQAK
jgi:hypothetical protein